MLDGFCHTCYAKNRRCWYIQTTYTTNLLNQPITDWTMMRKPASTGWRNIHQSTDIGRILWYDSSGMDYTCCGDADAAAEAPPRFTSSPRFAHVVSRTDEYYPPWRRKEAISWKTHFLAVANVVKVIWFRFRTLVARELPSSTKHGSAQIPLACTILRSVTVTSLLMNPLVTDHFTHIAAAASKFVASP